MVLTIISFLALFFVLSLCSANIVIFDYTLFMPSSLVHSGHGSFKTEPLPLDPQYVTGFVDADGCFHVSIRRDPKMKTGRGVSVILSIDLHAKDLPLLKSLQSFFGGVGYILINKNRQTAAFQVTKFQDIQNIIVPHFMKYPLLTQKRADFELFNQVVEIMKRKEHLNLEGINKIVSIRASMNYGLTKELKLAFPTTIPCERPYVELPTLPNIAPFWLAGFVDGEGCFGIDINKASTSIGYAVNLRFTVAQHARDAKLISSIISYLGCGTFWSGSPKEGAVLSVRRFSDISNIIIPFFNKYPLKGAKKSEFEDFCIVADIMHKKEHLTLEGLSRIREIKAGMNNGRKE
jgi:hypothetical protein